MRDTDNEFSVDTYLTDDGRVAIRLTGETVRVCEDGELLNGIALTPHAARELAFQLMEWAKLAEEEADDD